MLRFRHVLSATLVALLMVGGCGGDDSDGSYQGVGKLVAQRNEARKYGAQQREQKSSITDSRHRKPSGSGESITREEVLVVSKETGEVLATATLYTDKNGDIINIRIEK